MITVYKREGESANAVLFRFSKRIKQSGVLKEVKKRRFHKRPKSRTQRRVSALHRNKKREEFVRMKKFGLA